MARLFTCAHMCFAFLPPMLAAALGVGGFAHAGEERYDYDALGRLIRAIGDDAAVTEYEYDAVGNILSVRAGGLAQAPAVTDVAPDALRRGAQMRITVSGSGLDGTALTSPDARLGVSGVQVSHSEISFDLSVAPLVPLGPHSFVVANAAGSASFLLTVLPELPALAIRPGPVAVPPDGTPRNFMVTLSSPDSIDHVVSLATSDPAVVTVSPASVLMPAGQTEAAIRITGLRAGLAAVALESPALDATSIPVFVTAEFTGLTTSHAALLGVVREAAEGAGTSAPLSSPQVGIAIGAYLDGVSPAAVAIGGGPVALTISGGALEGVTGVSIEPPDGIELGPVIVAADGRSLTVPVTVAADAAQTTRRVVLAGAAAPYLPAGTDADRLLVTAPAPEIDSIEPIVAVPGSAHVAVTVRGRNLQRAQSVGLSPGTGVTVGASPAVNDDGTVLSVGIAVSPFAPEAEHVLTVTTPAGSSPATATPGNTFRVANEIQSVFTPIVSSLVGVTRGDAGIGAPDLSLQSANVGVALGPVVQRTSPRVGVVGEVTSLILHGASLGGVTTLELVPPTGVEVGEPVVSADGKSVTIALTVAADAPQTGRTLRVTAGDASVPFADPAMSRFDITVPHPVIHSVTPVVLVQGSIAVPVTIRGANLQGTRQVAFDPSDGIVASVPSVNEAGTEARISVTVAPDAVIGERVVVVASAAGASDAEPVPANSVMVVAEVGPVMTPIVSSQLGVVLGEGPSAPTTFGPLLSSAIAVVLESGEPPATVARDVRAVNLGLAVGPVITAVDAPALIPGGAGMLTVTGVMLGNVDAMEVVPPTGVAIDGLDISVDGRRATAQIAVDAGAAPGQRSLRVLQAGEPLPHEPAAVGSFRIGVGAPDIQSISPILGYQGDTLTLIVRGTNLHDTQAVLAEPADGLSIDSHPVVNAQGTELTLKIAIAPDAPLGARVLRVRTAGGTTPADSVPANTFTVHSAN